MGLYDTVCIGEREGQVKTWHNEFKRFRLGHSVPAIAGCTSYDIAMREGGYVHVEDLVLIGWTDTPASNDVFDKWGSLFDPESTGLSGESYLFS